MFDRKLEKIIVIGDGTIGLPRAHFIANLLGQNHGVLHNMQSGFHIIVKSYHDPLFQRQFCIVDMDYLIYSKAASLFRKLSYVAIVPKDLKDYQTIIGHLAEREIDSDVKIMVFYGTQGTFVSTSDVLSHKVRSIASNVTRPMKQPMSKVAIKQFMQTHFSASPSQELSCSNDQSLGANPTNCLTGLCSIL